MVLIAFVVTDCIKSIIHFFNPSSNILPAKPFINTWKIFECHKFNKEYFFLTKMSLFALDSQHQEQLLRLHDIDVDTAGEFCKVALQLFRSGPQPRMIEKASRKLDWPPEKLQSTLETIMELLKEAVKAEVLGKFNIGSSRLIAWLTEMCCWTVLIDRSVDWLIDWYASHALLFRYSLIQFFSVGSAWRSAHFIDFDGPERGIRQFARLGFWGIENWNPLAAERRHVWYCPTEDIWLAFWSGGSLYFSRNTSAFSTRQYPSFVTSILWFFSNDQLTCSSDSPTALSVDWLIDWLIALSIGRLLDWLVDWWSRVFPLSDSVSQFNLKLYFFFLI